MIVHCLESGSIGFESPLFPLPSRKISWAMEMYNPNVNPYRNDTQIVQNIYKKLAAFSAREISLKILGTFLPEARTCFCMQYCGSVHIGFPRQLRQCLLSFVQWRWCVGGRRNHAARESFSVKGKVESRGRL